MTSLDSRVRFYTISEDVAGIEKLPVHNEVCCVGMVRDLRCVCVCVCVAISQVL